MSLDWVQCGLWGTPLAAMLYGFKPVKSWFKQCREGETYNLLLDTLNDALVLNLRGRTVDEGIVMGKHVLARHLDNLPRAVIKFGQTSRVRAAHTLHPLEIHALTCVCAACAQTMESALSRDAIDFVRKEQADFTTAKQQRKRCAKRAATWFLCLAGVGGGWGWLGDLSVCDHSQ